MKCRKIHFSGHATIQMFKRIIEVDHVEHILKQRNKHNGLCNL